MTYPERADSARDPWAYALAIMQEHFAIDPHGAGGGGGAVASVNGHVGVVVLAAADVAAVAKFTTTATKTANYTASPADLVICDATAGGFTVTLPAAGTAGQQVAVKLKATAAGNAVTIARAGADTINGSLTSVSVGLAGQALTFVSDGAGTWNIHAAAPVPAAGQAPVTLTDAVTISVDATIGSQFKVTLGGNRTLGNPTGAYAGQMLLFAIKQDATGGRTLAFDTKFRFGTDLTSATLSTTAGKTDYLGVRYNLTDDKFDVVSFVRGF